MDKRILRAKDVLAIEAALGIARDKYKADADAIEKAGMKMYAGLAEQFRIQAMDAEHLRQAFEDSPTVTLTVDD